MSESQLAIGIRIGERIATIKQELRALELRAARKPTTAERLRALEERGAYVRDLRRQIEQLDRDVTAAVAKADAAAKKSSA